MSGIQSFTRLNRVSAIDSLRLCDGYFPIFSAYLEISEKLLGFGLNFAEKTIKLLNYAFRYFFYPT